MVNILEINYGIIEKTQSPVKPANRPPESLMLKEIFRAVALATIVITTPSFLVNTERSLLAVKVPEVDQTKSAPSSDGMPEAV